MMRKILIYGALLTALWACSKDERERLFEMVYPNIRFELPAGLPGGAIPQVLVLDGQLSRYQFFLQDNGVSDELVSAISPAIARLTNSDNLDFDFVSRISVRICPEGSDFCNEAEEVFYLEYPDLESQDFDRNLRLQPSLVNAKRVLSQERYKLEVWFNFLYSTPFSLSCQLDLTYDAVK